MKAVFRYKRVPKSYGISLRKGRPDGVRHLLPYSRTYGFGTMLPRECKPETKGGYTLCRIIGDDGNVLAEGEAWCSMADNFNYLIGRRIASGRAIKNMLVQPDNKS